jgi:hypothetical protein
MKCSAVALGVVLLAATVSAQSSLGGPPLPAAPGATTTAKFVADTTTDTTQPSPTLWAEAAPTAAIATAAPVATAAAEEGPQVLTARPPYNWELYAGYSFFDFYEVPNTTNLENGFDVAVNYFPGAGWIGAEGDLQSTFGHQLGCISKFVMASGGVRLRWAGPRGTQFFIHGLAGGAHYFPQTAYGGPNAFGYEGGGGVDIAHGRRMALRAEVDAVGTRFFGTYQYSPKFSLGIVFKF